LLRTPIIEAEQEEGAEGKAERRLSIFERIIFGTIVLNVLEAYLRLGWRNRAGRAAYPKSTLAIIIILIFIFVLVGTLTLLVSPRINFGNWLWPSRRGQYYCAASHAS
jgi:hypothetical protein